MSTTVYRYMFSDTVGLDEAEATLRLAVYAAEGLLGEAAVRLGFAYFRDTPRRAILVDGTSDAGDAVARVYTALLTREFGAGAYTLRRLGKGRTRLRKGAA